VIVFDASLALKWYIPESGSEASQAELARHIGTIIVPGVFLLEVTGALVRRANMNKSLRGELEAALNGFLALTADRFITVRETDGDEMARAAKIALDLGLPLKDCIYLALAMKMGCELLTSDRRFAAKAQPVWTRVRVLEG
jgi:hypothetical protein